MKGILRILGAILVIAWIVLWLAVKVTIGAVHLLLLAGLAMLVMGFVSARTK